MTDPLRSSDVADMRPDTTGRPAAVDGASTAAPARPSKPAATYPFKQPFTWWTRRRGYLLYMLREVTTVAIALWMILFVVEIARLRAGSGGYQPLGGPLFIAVSLVCLALAVWHSYTFLSLSGLIMRIPLGERTAPAQVIVGAAFAGFAVTTAVITGLLIWGGA